MTSPASPGDLDHLREAWLAAWPTALGLWGRYTRLAEPRWCSSKEQEADEHLTSSFAMIRLDDHAIVISLRQVQELGLQRFALEVMAHEIGHHVLAPGDLSDHGQMIARMRC